MTPDEFFRTDIRVGRILRAEEFPQARKPAYKLFIDFGALGEKRSSAQITTRYTPAELAWLVVAVTNFPPRQIASFLSEVLVLGVPDGTSGDVILLAPDSEVPPGTRVF